MSKMMKSRVCTLRLYNKFVNRCIAVLCFLRSRVQNSNDIFPFGPRETWGSFCALVSQGQGQMNENISDMQMENMKINICMAITLILIQMPNSSVFKDNRMPPFAFQCTLPSFSRKEILGFTCTRRYFKTSFIILS